MRKSQTGALDSNAKEVGHSRYTKPTSTNSSRRRAHISTSPNPTSTLTSLIWRAKTRRRPSSKERASQRSISAEWLCNSTSTIVLGSKSTSKTIRSKDRPTKESTKRIPAMKWMSCWTKPKMTMKCMLSWGSSTISLVASRMWSTSPLEQSS